MKKIHDRLFDGHVIRQESTRTSSEGLEYYAGIVRDGNIRYADVRTLILKFNSLDGDGSFGTCAGGYSPVESEYKNFPSYQRIPISEALPDAFEIFTDNFESIVKMEKKVWFHENRLENAQTINFTFWNDKPQYAFLVRGFQNDAGWRRDTFWLERGVIHKAPTATANGLAKSGRPIAGRPGCYRFSTKIVMSKKAQMVDREEVLEKIYPFMKERIQKMFNDFKK